MKIDTALFAEGAEVRENGTFSVLNAGFDILRGATFPGSRDVLYLLVRISLSEEEAGQPLSFRIDIVGPSGQNVQPEMLPKPTTSKSNRDSVTLCVAYIWMTFPEPGTYRFRIWVGDQMLGETSLKVLMEGTDVNAHS